MKESQNKEIFVNKGAIKTPSFIENVMSVIFFGIVLTLYIVIFRGGWFLPTFFLSVPLTISLYKNYPVLKNPTFLLGIILLIMFVLQVILNSLLSFLGLVGFFLPFILIIGLIIYYLSQSVDSYSAKVCSTLFLCIVSTCYNIIYGPAWLLPTLILTVPLTQLFVDDRKAILSKLPSIFKTFWVDRLCVSGAILLTMAILQYGFKFLYSLNGAIVPIISFAIAVVTIIYFLHPRYLYRQ